MPISKDSKISEFPDVFNKLEGKVQQLTQNTKGIKEATWVTAIATATLTLLAITTFFLGVNDSSYKLDAFRDCNLSYSEEVCTQLLRE